MELMKSPQPKHNSGQHCAAFVDEEEPTRERRIIEKIGEEKEENVDGGSGTNNSVMKNIESLRSLEELRKSEPPGDGMMKKEEDFCHLSLNHTPTKIRRRDLKSEHLGSQTSAQKRLREGDDGFDEETPKKRLNTCVVEAPGPGGGGFGPASRSLYGTESLMVPMKGP